MKSGDVVRLLALGAIWGASFLFMRIVAPVLGPIATADLRMLVAGVGLLAWFHLTGFDPQWRRWSLQYAAGGLINSGAPFILFGFAALHIGAGEMAVLNATSPMWGALLSAAFLGERVGMRRWLAIAMGFGGALVVIQPSFAIFGATSLLPLGCAFLFSLYLLLNRAVGEGDSPLTMQTISG